MLGVLLSQVSSSDISSRDAKVTLQAYYSQDDNFLLTAYMYIHYLCTLNESSCKRFA